MWASVGWGGMSPIAGAVVANFGLPFSFGIYFVICLLAFVPTCMLPFNVLSAPTISGTEPVQYALKGGENTIKASEVWMFETEPFLFCEMIFNDHNLTVRF